MKLHMNFMEGLTNDTSNSITGEGDSAENYLSTLKNQVKNITDKLSVDKNKQKYENIVIQMDDYINVLMLKTMLNIDPRNTDPFSYMQDLKNLNYQ